MKYQVIILTTALLSVSIITDSYSQTKTNQCYSGVYITYYDYLQNRVSYKINTKVKENRIGFVVATKTIKIVTPDTTVKYRPGSIYGFYDCKAMFRYSPDVELYSPEDYYKIEEMGSEESGKLVIYSSVFSGGNELFFSTGLNSPIHRLNISHLEKCFKELFPKFIEAVQNMKAQNHRDLSAKDSTGYFLINKLYRQYVTHY